MISKETEGGLNLANLGASRTKPNKRPLVLKAHSPSFYVSLTYDEESKTLQFVSALHRTTG
ncbi:MAG: hypothetical protein ACI9F9_002267 [Candidatus Paceibacteria bacterium]|jgi:hypothetical protein